MDIKLRLTQRQAEFLDEILGYVLESTDESTAYGSLRRAAKEINRKLRPFIADDEVTKELEAQEYAEAMRGMIDSD